MRVCVEQEERVVDGAAFCIQEEEGVVFINFLGFVVVCIFAGFTFII